jgi:hypothetical protein
VGKRLVLKLEGLETPEDAISPETMPTWGVEIEIQLSGLPVDVDDGDFAEGNGSYVRARVFSARPGV